MEERGGADRGGRRGLLQKGRIAAKMNYVRKVSGPVCGLSVWEPVIHRPHYFQTELRLCSLACASLIMQIWAVRQNITAAISQSGFRRYTNISAFVSVSLATPKWNDCLAARAAECRCRCRFTWAASDVVCGANQSEATEELKDVAVSLCWFGLRDRNSPLTLRPALIADYKVENTKAPSGGHLYVCCLVIFVKSGRHLLLSAITFLTINKQMFCLSKELHPAQFLTLLSTAGTGPGTPCNPNSDG